MFGVFSSKLRNASPEIMILWQYDRDALIVIHELLKHRAC